MVFLFHQIIYGFLIYWMQVNQMVHCGRYFAERVVKGRKAVHIGDNQKTDVDMAIGYGIHTYLSPSPWDLLVTSSF